LVNHDPERDPRCLCRPLLFAAAGVCLLVSSCRADGLFFFVTYTSYMEEVRSLDIEMRGITGKPQDSNRFAAAALEFEYGATEWWSTEFYLDGQTTANEATVFTGYRFENRFRLLRRQHRINPVIYVEFENLNGADKTLLEVTGHDGLEKFQTPTDVARRVKNRELEGKLILDSRFKGFTLAENVITEKNVNGEPWAFGYAVGLARPLARGGAHCGLCLQSFVVGAEVYGGVGTTENFGLQNTSHYVGPTLMWMPVEGTSIKISPNFGLTGNSAHFLLRIGFSYEIDEFGRSVAGVFRKFH
jgi:hypothetical protein